MSIVFWISSLRISVDCPPIHLSFLPSSRSPSSRQPPFVCFSSLHSIFRASIHSSLLITLFSRVFFFKLTSFSNLTGPEESGFESSVNFTSWAQVTSCKRRLELLYELFHMPHWLCGWINTSNISAKKLRITFSFKINERVCYLVEHNSRPFDITSVQMQDGVRVTRTKVSGNTQDYMFLAFVYPHNPFLDSWYELLKLEVFGKY